MAHTSAQQNLERGHIDLNDKTHPDLMSTNMFPSACATHSGNIYRFTKVEYLMDSGPAFLFTIKKKKKNEAANQRSNK